ncbi:MAG: lantibiotic dehydratase [Candidatus Acidiferrum sp.]
MGVGIANNGDVWIADGSNNQLLYFPGGDLRAGKIVKVAGLRSPFDIVIARACLVGKAIQTLWPDAKIETKNFGQWTEIFVSRDSNRDCVFVRCLSVKDLVPAGFFVLRTPLLPFDELQSWSDGLAACSALSDLASLEKALAQDREHLRARLREILSRPEVREALFVASPHLDKMFDVWLCDPEGERGQGIERALVRYFMRMAGRSTPFGLCAGCSTGSLGDKTDLMLEELAKYQRHTRLGIDYLFALTETLGRDCALRRLFVYRPNSSLHRAAGRMRYVESRTKDKECSYHLVTAEDTDYLAATVTRAEKGATFETLASALADDEVSLEEAEEYIEELIESQILIPDIALPLTGCEPIHPLIDQLFRHPETARIAEGLSQARAELAAMDADGLGVSPARYRKVACALEDLPVTVDLQRLFQVDMMKPASKATLGSAVVAELSRGVELLHRLSSPVDHEEAKRFRDAFFNRYESREVPLLEALDEEVGVGFETGRETTPLLEGLHFSSPGNETAAWGARERFLLRKLSEAVQKGADEIVLTQDDLDGLASTSPPPLPDAFAVASKIVSRSEAALAQGDFRIALDSVNGPSGAPLLGRFCHADQELRQHVERHLRAEEALQPNAVFAEIVHLPEGHFGNFICRPALRGYEIPYLGCAGVSPSQQIAAADLTVSVRGDHIILRSQRLGCEIIPRMSCAHNYTLSGLGVYRFVCALQHQGVAQSLSWNWGALKDAPFLPRVVTGRLVLSCAQWRLSKKELKQFGQQHGAALFRAIKRWRSDRRIPRWIALADADNTLPVDLDNIISIETFVHLVRSREEATLIEMYPAPNELGAHGPEGRFVHELIVPFVRTYKSQEPPERNRPGNAFPLAASRTFPPGSEWLYAKLYTGTGMGDHVLREVVAPLVRKLIGSGAVDRWFFIRYGDPDWHLRLRFHGIPEKLHGELLPLLQTAVSPLLNDGRLWRIQLDTYEREVERYGGPEAIGLAEKIFHVDSEAVMQLISMFESGDQGLDQRWRLTMRGIDALLTDFGFDLDSKSALLQQSSKNFTKDQLPDKNLLSELSEKFRKERKSLEELLNPARDAKNPSLQGFDILRRRSEQIAPIIAELKACAQTGQLVVSFKDFVLSCAHMHANRLLRSAHREQELVIHDFLSRLYKSKAAQERNRR